ncbi:MAG TPA: hypothetical protein VN958_07205 [Chitinophagaceae bacterium]|nr:hypothetical protein [Chitinophagaceae bacterium]
MKTTQYGGPEIDRLLNAVRNYDNTIGTYQQHLILPDDGTYVVKLTNGILHIYPEELKDKLAIPKERLKDIAARFREK